MAVKLLTVIGARPQFIKAAPVSRALIDAGVDEILVHTGQHYDERLSEIFFEELKIPEPTFNLKVGSGTHGVQTADILKGVEEILLEHQPDGMLVYGDTNSTLAGALAASKLHIPVFHVEAGLRSYNRKMPEEQNRIVTDHLASLLFCPTQVAIDNLKKEGIEDGVSLTGDVMLDAAMMFGEVAESVDREVQFGVETGEYVLATVHRAENTDDESRFREICRGLNAISRETKVLWPVHPRSRKTIDSRALESELTDVSLIEPVSFLEMIQLLKGAKCVVTDSGGVQKEAYFHRTPCLTLRDETEWVETVEAKWNHLVPADSKAILKAFSNIATPDTTIPEYGDGRAAQIIARLVSEFLNPS